MSWLSLVAKLSQMGKENYLRPSWRDLELSFGAGLVVVMTRQILLPFPITDMSREPEIKVRQVRRVGRSLV
jgi:hypothetical protein